MTTLNDKFDYISARLNGGGSTSANIPARSLPPQARFTDFMRVERPRKTLTAEDCSFYQSAGPVQSMNGIYDLNGLKNPRTGQVDKTFSLAFTWKCPISNRTHECPNKIYMKKSPSYFSPTAVLWKSFANLTNTEMDGQWFNDVKTAPKILTENGMIMSKDSEM